MQRQTCIQSLFIARSKEARKEILEHSTNTGNHKSNDWGSVLKLRFWGSEILRGGVKSFLILLKTKSIRKSSNITLRWAKIKYQNNLNPIALFSTLFIKSRYKLLPLITPTTISYQGLRKWISKLTSYRHNLMGNHFVKSFLKRFSGIQWNFEICFRCSVVLEKRFKIVTKMFSIRWKNFWYIIFSTKYSKNRTDSILIFLQPTPVYNYWTVPNQSVMIILVVLWNKCTL